MRAGPAWRAATLEVYRGDLFPDILIMDTAGFAVQDRMFTRLACFLEKRGWRMPFSSILSDMTLPTPPWS